MGTLSVDGNQVGQGRIDQTLCCRISLDETFDVGADTGTSANPADYDVPNKFTCVFNFERGNGSIKLGSVLTTLAWLTCRLHIDHHPPTNNRGKMKGLTIGI